jgi:hypothetical protein
LKKKLKGSHFTTIEVIQAESQAVLNHKEHDFQDVFKKIAEVLGTMHTHGWGQKAQVNF